MYLEICFHSSKMFFLNIYIFNLKCHIFYFIKRYIFFNFGKKIQKTVYKNIKQKKNNKIKKIKNDTTIKLITFDFF